MGNLTSGDSFSECRSLVFERKIPSIRIDVKGGKEDFHRRGWFFLKAAISSLNALLWASLIISSSVANSSAGVSSPVVL